MNMAPKLEKRIPEKNEMAVMETITESATSFVLQSYGVTEISELTEEQIADVAAFAAENTEYLLHHGLNDIVSTRESV